MNKKNKMKGEKLLHYFEREPVRFIQHDGFINIFEIAAKERQGSRTDIVANLPE